MSQTDREQHVSEAFVALADTLVDDYDVIDLLEQLVAHSVALLSVDAAGLMLGDAHGQLSPVAASGPDADTSELLQLPADEGPGLEAYHTVRQVRVPDMTQATDRWPRFTAEATRLGAFASVHAIPMRLRGRAIGALNLFHREPGPLSEPELSLGQALADVATIGILQERAITAAEHLSAQLQTALNSRVIIEQAKGVLAQRLGVGVDAAFGLLRRHARNQNRRLSEVARQAVDNELDPDVLRGCRPPGPRGQRRN